MFALHQKGRNSYFEVRVGRDYKRLHLSSAEKCTRTDLLWGEAQAEHTGAVLSGPWAIVSAASMTRQTPLRQPLTTAIMCSNRT